MPKTDAEIQKYFKDKQDKERAPILAFLRSIAVDNVTRRVSWNEIAAHSGYSRDSQPFFLVLWNMEKAGILKWRDKQEPEKRDEDATWIFEILEPEKINPY